MKKFENGLETFMDACRAGSGGGGGGGGRGAMPPPPQPIENRAKFLYFKGKGMIISLSLCQKCLMLTAVAQLASFFQPPHAFWCQFVMIGVIPYVVD